MSATIKVVVDDKFFRRPCDNDCASNLAKDETLLAFCRGREKFVSWSEVCDYFGLGEYFRSLPAEDKETYRWVSWVSDRDYCRGTVEDSVWVFPQMEFAKKLFLGAELTLRWKAPSEDADLWVLYWGGDNRPKEYVITDILLSDEGSELLDKVTGE